MDEFVEAYLEREAEKLDDWATEIIGLFTIEGRKVGCRGCNRWIGWGGEHTPGCSHEKAYLDFVEGTKHYGLY